MCYLVEFDLLFAFSVLSCRILDCASLFILCSRMRSSMLSDVNRGNSCIRFVFVDLVPVATENYSVEYSLESVEEYSECAIHKGNVNIVYFINQARANTRISRTELIYDESMRLQMVTYI